MSLIKNINCCAINIFSLSLLLLSAGSSVNAQQVFKTIEGDVVLSGAYKEKQVSFVSNSLFARINYETAEILLTLNPNTLHSTVSDSTGSQFVNSSIGIATLKGKMNIPFVNTLKHPDHKLKFEAELQINGVVKSVIVTGLLKHISDRNSVACMLTLNFMIGMKDFGIILPENYSDQVFVSVSQAVLKPENQ